MWPILCGCAMLHGLQLCNIAQSRFENHADCAKSYTALEYLHELNTALPTQPDCFSIATSELLTSATGSTAGAVRDELALFQP